jgi:RNA polymerase sigma factor (sigma-70 family)
MRGHTPTGPRDSLSMSTAMAGPASPSATSGAALGDPELRRFLRDYVKKRVGQDDVDDVVQTVLVDALASTKRPDDPAEIRKWLVGIARHKCADVHRRAGRERPADEDLPDQPAQPPPVEERALVRWAEEQAQSTREADKTLGWMAREGEGDKLEHIAEEEALPAARVRQRVSRMRRFLKERWLAEVALVAALGAVAFFLWRALRRDEGPIVADPTPPKTATPIADPLRDGSRVLEGRRLREATLDVCRNDEHQRCLDDLDRARELDPVGDAAPDVRQARERAAAALRQPPPIQEPQQTKEPAPTPTEVPPAPKQAPKPPPPSKEQLFKQQQSDPKKGDVIDVVDEPPPAKPTAAPPPPAPPPTSVTPQAPTPPPPTQAPFPTKKGKTGFSDSDFKK